MTMVITYSADEIFEIAEEIERNAAELYREAAEKSLNEETRKLLLDMSAIENEHLETFQSMREKLSAEDGLSIFE